MLKTLNFQTYQPECWKHWTFKHTNQNFILTGMTLPLVSIGRRTEHTAQRNDMTAYIHNAMVTDDLNRVCLKSIHCTSNDCHCKVVMGYKLESFALSCLSSFMKVHRIFLCTKNVKIEILYPYWEHSLFQFTQLHSRNIFYEICWQFQVNEQKDKRKRAKENLSSKWCNHGSYSGHPIG